MTDENELSQTAKDVQTAEVTVEYLNALRKAGLHLIQKLRRSGTYAQTLDPHGDDHRYSSGRFPGSDVWIAAIVDGTMPPRDPNDDDDEEDEQDEEDEEREPPVVREPEPDE